MGQITHNARELPVVDQSYSAHTVDTVLALPTKTIHQLQQRVLPKHHNSIPYTQKRFNYSNENKSSFSSSHPQTDGRTPKEFFDLQTLFPPLHPSPTPGEDSFAGPGAWVEGVAAAALSLPLGLASLGGNP